ncbi:hypothetical protein [Tenacibaculum aestuariivivum]|uniref:hypothetical protein n=1 Tax=Tenacibaculum aestuariivivum TaxID=2006131 RepID=UPI003AB64153
MEKEIKNWQNLWKEKKSVSIDINMFIKKVNSIEKKGKLERIILLIGFPLTIIILTIILPFFSNIYSLMAILLIGLGIVILLIQVYKSRFYVLNENMLNSQKYITFLIIKLKKRMLITSRYMWVYTFLLILGLNVGYIYILNMFNISLILKGIVHIVLSSIIFFFMYYGIEKKKKKNRKEILPLIEFLEKLHINS